MLPLALTAVSSGPLVAPLVLVVGFTSVGVNVKLVVPVLPSPLVTVMVTVCVASLNAADSDQLQPVFVNEPIVPSEAVTVVMPSSYSLMLPLALTAVSSGPLVAPLVTLVVGFTSVGVKVKLVVPVEPSPLVTVMVTVCVASLSSADSDQLQPVFVNEPIVPSEAVT